MMQTDQLLPIALVTGGAVRIGRAIGLTLAREGYGIILHYHQSQLAAEQTAQEIRELGVPVWLVQADLTDPCQIDRLFQPLKETIGRLSVLVNSASVMPSGDLRITSVEAWDQAMNLNLRAPWLCAQKAAEWMKETGGIIINITDVGARKIWSGFGAYVISKSGLETLTRLLAKTLAPGVRVNAVAPGLILAGDDFPAEDWQRLVDRLPMKHQGDPDHVAQAVLFLIRSTYITGETLVIDGGYQLI